MKTKSEQILESFFTQNNLVFEKIEEDTSSRPDYLVHVGNSELIFEVKELAEDKKFGVVKNHSRPHITSNFRIPGDHVRKMIRSSKKQIQYGAKKGIPSILLIYNNIDPDQKFGTEDLDFTTAMYGQLTIDESKTSDLFQGRNDELQESKNTSFGALGRLADRNGRLSVTLFENVYSTLTVPYELLPPCFEVKRIVVSNAEPL